jgi:hypothetical protein
MAMMGILMTYPQFMVTVVACFFTLAVGLVALVWPEKMQRYAVKHCTRFYFWQNPFLGWMKTSGYIAYLRFVGVVFLGFGLFALLVAITGRK